MAETPISNQQFATDVGCHHSMASRLFSGERVPSVEMLNSISTAYGIPVEDLVAKTVEGPAAFGVFLRSKLGRQTPDELASA